MNSEIDFDAPLEELAGAPDVPKSFEDLRIDTARAERAVQDNSHRKKLFWVIVSVVCGALLCVVFLVGLLLFNKNLSLETPIVIAFISAMAVQSFILIGFLVKGLYPTASSGTSSDRVE